MKNITLEMDDEVLEKARAHAAERNTSLEAIVREHLERIAITQIAAGDEKREEARKALLRLMGSSEGRMAPDRKFDREEAHQR
jgi:hypothetical protein